MIKFLVNIWAFEHHGRFTVEAEDNPTSLENAIVDKLGENDIVWEYLGKSYDDRVNRITYEEVINGDAYTSNRPLQTEKGSGPRMGAGAS